MEISVEKRNIYLSLILLLTLLSAIFIYQISISNTVQTNISKIKSNSSNKHTRNSDSKLSESCTSTSDNSKNNNSSDNSKNSNSNSDSSSSDTSQTNNADEIKKIAITFDDGPHPKYTLKLLDGLKKRNVKATFFVIGENVSNNPDVIKRMAEDGHLIGNHTYSHVQLTCISEEKAITEINKTSELITTYAGVSPKYIRPPYGMYSDALKRETNLTPVLWTVDPRDWSVLNTDSVVKHVLKRAKSGDIILLHDIFDTSVEAAFQIIDALKAEGYEFVTVDEFIKIN